MIRQTDDAGFSLVEFAVAFALSALIGTFMLAWMNTLMSSQRTGEETAQTQTDLLAAKERLVKELRFADSISADPSESNAHRITVWIDRIGVGTEGAFDADAGEEVTWEILSDGSLVRSTDEPGTSAVTVIDSLVYDAAAGSGSSTFEYPTPESVEITLVGRSGGADGLRDPIVISTSVRLRNA